MPEGMHAMRDVIANERSAPRDKIAAAKLVTDVAGAQGQVGVKSGYSMRIDFGKYPDGRECGITLRDITLYPRN
jgi:hypothetical protein